MDISNRLFNNYFPKKNYHRPIATFTSGLKPKERQDKFKKYFNNNIKSEPKTSANKAPKLKSIRAPKLNRSK